MKSLIFAVALMLQINDVTAAIVPPREVQSLLRPILDLCAEAEESQGEHQNAVFYQVAKQTGGLFQMRTKAADEALVVLMNFYIGESPGQDLLHQVTVRGKRMLPLLLKYRNAHVIFSQRKYPSSILLAHDVKKEFFENAIESVTAGKVFGED